MNKQIILAGVFVIAMTALMFEVGLTRIFSILLFYHYVFIVVAAGTLGLGLGGLVVYRIHSRMLKRNLFEYLVIFAWLLSASILLSTVLTTKIVPLDSAITYLLVIFVAGVPFFFVGLILSLCFTQLASVSHTLYFADLIGAGTGCLLVVILLGYWGEINVVLFLVLLGVIGSLLFSLGTPTKAFVISSVVLSILGVSYLAYNLSVGSNSMNFYRRTHPNKTLFQELSDDKRGARIVHTEWSSFSRVDVVEEKDNEREKIIYTDAGAESLMFKFDGHLEKVDFLRQDIGFFPFWWGETRKMLIIGPGGGKDIVVALMGGAHHITAVEVNSAIIAAVRKYSDFNGYIYDYENVDLVVDEGRRFIQRSQEAYDMIYLSQAVTQSAEMMGYSLTENYLYTKEAFDEFLEHLSPGGRIAIVFHDHLDLTRGLVTMIEVLGETGKTFSEAQKHILMVNKPTVQDRIFMPLLVVKKTPFTEVEIHDIAQLAKELEFDLLFAPYIEGSPFYFQALQDESSFEKFVSDIERINVEPVTDERPFFYQFSRGVPPYLRNLLVLFLAIGILCLIIPLLQRRKRSEKDLMFYWILYFWILGLGFMFIQVTLVQKFTFFLGNPVLSLSIALFSLLMSGGIGSLLSGRFAGKVINMLRTTILGILVITASYSMVLSWLFDKYLQYSVLQRSLISVGLLFPLGLLMGIPFPTGLRLASQRLKNDVPLMWGTDSITSVLGSVAAIAIAILWGFRVGFLLGTVSYVALLLLLFYPRGQEGGWRLTSIES